MSKPDLVNLLCLAIIYNNDKPTLETNIIFKPLYNIYIYVLLCKHYAVS